MSASRPRSRLAPALALALAATAFVGRADAQPGYGAAPPPARPPRPPSPTPTPTTPRSSGGACPPSPPALRIGYNPASPVVMLTWPPPPPPAPTASDPRLPAVRIPLLPRIRQRRHLRRVPPRPGRRHVGHGAILERHPDSQAGPRNGPPGEHRHPYRKQLQWELDYERMRPTAATQATRERTTDLDSGPEPRPELRNLVGEHLQRAARQHPAPRAGSLAGPNIPIPEEMLKGLNLTNKSSLANSGLLGGGGNFFWPETLDGEAYDDLLEALHPEHRPGPQAGQRRRDDRPRHPPGCR